MMGVTPEAGGAAADGGRGGRGRRELRAGHRGLRRHLPPHACGHRSAAVDQGQRGHAGSRRRAGRLPDDAGRVRLPRAGPGGGRGPVRRRLLRHIARIHRRTVQGDSPVKSRERVVRAIHHRRRTACRSMWGHSAVRHRGLHLSPAETGIWGSTRRTRVFDLYQMLAEIEQPVLGTVRRRLRGAVPPRPGLRHSSMRTGNRGRCSTGLRSRCRADFQPQHGAGRQPGDCARRRADRPHARDGFYFDRLEKFPGAAHIDLDGYQPPLLTRRSVRPLSRPVRSAVREHRLGDRRPTGPALRAVLRAGNRRLRELDDHAGLPSRTMCTGCTSACVTAWIENLKRFVDAVEDRVPDPAVLRRLRHAAVAVPVGGHVSPAGHAPLPARAGLDPREHAT